MKETILEFYLKTSMYTNYLPFQDYYLSLSDDVGTLAYLIKKQTIHRAALWKDSSKKGEISQQYPWYKYRCDDDVLLTAPAIMAELFRQDSRGITEDRDIKDKIVVTCRYVSLLAASILKAKGIPARVRSGFKKIAGRYPTLKSGDHWIVQYYNHYEKRWINLDVDQTRSTQDYQQLDMSFEDFDFAWQAWLDVRKGKKKVDHFCHGSHYVGMDMLATALFLDFHSLFNDEIGYLFSPTYLSLKEFSEITKGELEELDHLAELMKDPDQNFDELRYLFYNDPNLRVINSPLVGVEDHVEFSNGSNIL